MNNKKKAATLILFFWFYILLICPSTYAKDKVNLDLIGRWRHSGEINCIEILKIQSPKGHSTYAYCGTRNGFLTLEVTDPKNPREVSSIEIGSVEDSAFYQYISREYAVLAVKGNNLVILDITDPFKPIYTGRYQTSKEIRGLAISGHYAFLACDDGMVIIDISDPSHPTITGVYLTQGDVVGIAISGNYCFLADWYKGLVIVDVSDLYNPTYVGRYYPVLPLGIAVSGNYVFLADYYKGLVIIDVSDPSNPIYVGGYETNYPLDIAISGSYAYIANKFEGLLIIDVSDPSHPTYVGRYYRWPGWGASDVAISGNYAFLSDGGPDLVIVDISNPTAPPVVGRYFTPGEAQIVTLSGNYAYVKAGLSDMVVIDISDPSHPAYAGIFEAPGMIYDLAISGNYAFLACGEKGLVIVDIADTFHPTYAGVYQSASSPYQKTYDVALSGNYAFLADGRNGLIILDISNPSHPNQIGKCDTSGEAFVVTVSGTLALVASYWGGTLNLIDISDPSHPTPLGKYDNSRRIYHIVISGSYAFLACGEEGLVIIDISDPYQPSFIGNYVDEYSSAFEVAISDNYAYVAGTLNLLEVIDISDPSKPTMAGPPLCCGGSDIRSVTISGTYAFLADIYKGLVIVDISALTPWPTYVGGINTYGNALGVTILGNYAFLIDERNGLIILDISNPARPTNVRGYDDVEGIAISGNYAFLAAGWEGLVIIDITDPSHPTYLGKYDTPGHAENVHISGSYAFLADGNNGLVIIDISDPSQPAYVGGYNNTYWYAHGLVISGNFAFVVNQWGTLDIVNISDPSHPTYVREYDTPGWVEDITLVGSLAFVADGLNGLGIIDISDPYHPHYIGGYDTPGRAHSLTMSNNYAFIFDAFGLIILDISELSHPTCVGEYYTLGNAHGVAISNNHAFVADGNNGLTIIDISQLSGPALAGKYHTLNALDIAISNNHALVTDWDGLVILDISNPSFPTLAGGYNAQWGAPELTISDNFAFMADDFEGLIIIDISDPSYPTYVGGCDTAGRAQGVIISGSYALVVVSEDYLDIIDISDLSNPTYLGRYKASEEIYDIAVSGHYAFLANGENGMVIIDISDPSHPAYVGRYDNGRAQGVIISGSYAFVVVSEFNLDIIDISDPSNPTYLGRYKASEEIYDIAVSGHYAFLANGENGLIAIDISDPSHPTYASGYNTAGKAQGVDISGSFAFVADGNNGVLIFLVIKAPQQQGNLILCPSGPSSSKNFLWDPSQDLANMAYLAFLGQNYYNHFTYYLNPDPSQDIDGDGTYDPLVVDDFTPTKEELHNALTNWAYNRLNIGPLYLYFTGLGTEDAYQIMPGEILNSKNLDEPNTSLKQFLDTFQQDPNRDIICLFEFASSGTFCDDLIDPNTLPYSRTIITCTDEGTSYLDTTGLQSFTGHLLTLFQDTNQIDPGLFEDIGSSYYQRVRLLQGIFSQARKTFWARGFPFNTQPPQMVTALGPHTLTNITLKPDPLNSTIPDPNYITLTSPDQYITLTAYGHYTDTSHYLNETNGPTPLPNDQIHYHSSDPSILQVTPEGAVFPNPNTSYNGKAYILATIIDPNFEQAPNHNSNFTQSPGLNPDLPYFDPNPPCSDPNHPNHPCLGGVTGRIPISVDIPTWQEKENLPLAIIVAGEKEKQDYLWEETHTIAQYAYMTLLSRGYSRKRIHYLTHLQKELLEDLDPLNDKDTDLDKDGDPNNDIDGIPSRETLREAIEWVKEKGTNSLTIILINHGKESGGFYLRPPENDPESLLTPGLLKESLDALQAENPNLKITLIIESCYSGCFIEPLRGENRIILTSASHNEESNIYAKGLVSFSYYLLTYLQSGTNLASAYDITYRSMCEIDAFLHKNRQTLNEPKQKPQIYNKDLARTISLGGDFLISQDQPVIISVDISPDPNTIQIDQNITIKARASDLDGITQVWAIINATYSPPVFTGDPERPIVDLPRIDLEPKEGAYEGTYKGFIYPGPYSILVFAKDTKGHVSLPYHQSIEVTGKPLLNALLISGWEKDSSFSSLLSHAQWVLKQKGFSRIEQLQEPTLKDIADSLNSFDPDNTDQLFVYLIGPRDDNTGSFALSASEILDPDTLEGLLAPFSSCTQVVLIDTPGARDFFKETPNRIYVWSASSGEEAYLEKEGYCAFSHFFFTCIFKGASVFQAYNYSSWAMENYSRQTPWLEDGKKWKLAQATYLGSPFVIKRAGPRITVPEDKTVWGYETLWAEIKEEDPNTRVWALVKEPGKGQGELIKVNLSWVSEGRYEAPYCFLYPGAYEVYTYVQDTNGLIDYDMTTYEKTSTDVTYPLNLPKGWSMISLPVMPHNPTLSDVFPDAVVVYEYQKEAGYVRVAKEENLEDGRGYWVLFNDEQNPTLIGQPILEHALTLSEDGWRMIGGCTHPARVSVDHGHICVIYGYVQGVGYKRVTSSEGIEPGKGYWILINNIVDQAELKVEGQVH